MVESNTHVHDTALSSAVTLLAELPHSGRLNADGVHQVRRMSKRARAILRLAEDAGRPDAETARRALTRAAKQLSSLRDAAVVARTAAQLEGELEGKMREVARTLAACPAPEPADGWWDAVWRSFAAARREVGQVDQSALTSKALAKALRCSIRRMEKRMRRVRSEADIDRAHEWRKAVLLLRHQLAAVFPGGERGTDKLQQRLKKLGHTLGVAADCEQLFHAIDQRSWPRSLERAAARLASRTAKRRDRAIRRACKQSRSVKRALPANLE